MSSFFKFRDWMLIIILCFFLSVIWFHSGLITGGGEEGLAFYDPDRTYELSRNMWWDYASGFPTLAWLPHHNLFLSLFILQKFFHLPNYILQAGTFFLLLVTGSLSMYFLTKELLKENGKVKYVPLVAAIFYIFNPFSMSQIWGRGLIPQFFCFALLPLSLLIFIRGLKNRNLLYALFLGFVSALYSSAFGVTTFVIAYWVVLIVVMISWFVLTKEKGIKAILFYFVLGLSVWAIFNANWLVPTFFAGSTIYGGSLANPEENVGTLLGVSMNYPFHVLIRLLQDTYFFAPSAFSPLYSNIFFQLISFLLPFFLFIGLFYILRKNEFKKFRLFGILFIVGLIVSLGANPPFGWLFVWVFEKAPFLQGFRNPYEKFGIVYALAYAPLFALGLVYFFQKIIKNKSFRFVGLITVLVLVCGIYVWPMWTGKILGGHELHVGIDVPEDYKKVSDWLRNRDDGSRVAMTPFWSGDGAFYQWGNSQYRGLDPTMYLFHSPAISNNPSNFPYFSDFMKHIRQNIYQKDVSGALALFRIKYLLNREDAVNISSTEKSHITFLTKAIYPSVKAEDNSELFCQDKVSSSSGATNPAWISCELKGEEKNFYKSKYLHVAVKVEKQANLDLAIKDTQQNRPRWYGKDETTYFIPANRWTNLVLPLGVPTEVNDATNFKDIAMVEIFAHPVNRHSESVDKIELRGMWLDEGMEERVNNFKFIKTIGKSKIYEMIDNKIPPEFGLLNSVEKVSSFDELIEKSQQKRGELDKHGFILITQNKEKNFKPLTQKSTAEISEMKRISDTRYWVELKKSKTGMLILSQRFHSEWKVIPGVDKNELDDTFFNNLNLLKKSVLSEEDHYVVNGYANLWRLDGKSDKYAVIFLPQVYAEIGAEVAKYGVIFLILAFCYLMVYLIYYRLFKKF